ncbi:hypothetical protein [Piscinibacter gummiphilus]|uniref:Uncharacterized protein n=1 Tax=Piscinibacter gummiphilus TaxID=946333 RepID=A0ABZ0D2G9_9BURK|nr:hypothetical protein [Piscinibacter gummiphilus]WOB11330.1 hypothetical protein RXV79_28015 [Piscinibacter gummiphilus]
MILEARAVAQPRIGAEEAEFSEYLRGVALGSYARNHSLIRLGRDASFWHPENEPTLHRFAVFVHEYLHFIHNYSTVVGLYDFFVQLRLVRLYCSTVDSEGKSHGERVLSSGEQEESRSVLAWRRHLRGSAGGNALNALRRAKAHPPLMRIESSDFQLVIGPQKIDAHHVSAIFDASELGVGLASIEIQLGGDVLMEGCAIEAECLLYEKFGASAGEVRKQLPAYPYLTARAVFEGIAGFSPTSGFLCRVCVLALQSTDPGAAFVQLAEACKIADLSVRESDLIRIFLANSKDFFRSAVQLILEESLQREVAPFATRGLAGRGLQRMAGWANDLFNRRLEDEFFELGPVETMPDLVPMVAMLRSLPTCPVVQEIDTSTDSQELLYFSEIEVPVELTREIGAAQALFHLTDAHTFNGVFSETPPAVSRACPFFKACRAPLATASPEICGRRPWESFSPAATEGCFYSAGVICSRGRSDL